MELLPDGEHSNCAGATNTEKLLFQNKLKLKKNIYNNNHKGWHRHTVAHTRTHISHAYTHTTVDHTLWNINTLSKHTHKHAHTHTHNGAQIYTRTRVHYRYLQYQYITWLIRNTRYNARYNIHIQAMHTQRHDIIYSWLHLT